MKNYYFLLILLILLLTQFSRGKSDKIKEKEKLVRHPPCKACKILTDSFKYGQNKTARGKYEGGDAAWEEKKLKDYSVSEIRLIEIQDLLCSDVKIGEDQCHILASDNEHLIEKWWKEIQNEEPDIYKWLCIDELKVCCPPNHYGPTCELCPNCNGNGKCKGNSTRKGNGKCLCDTGYAGEFCDSCATQYYAAFQDNNKLLCSPCHVSCGDKGCSNGGPKSCQNCKSGWLFTENSGCLDINECIETPDVCHKNQFCVNNDGSYTCLECDRSCDGCIADGPDMCKKCAEGYEMKDEKCIDLTTEKRDQYVNFTRFLTYLGLCIATCVIFQNSTSIACVVGIAVAIYISASEYWLNTSPSSSSSSSIIDTKHIEEMIKNSL